MIKNKKNIIERKLCHICKKYRLSKFIATCPKCANCYCINKCRNKHHGSECKKFLKLQLETAKELIKSKPTYSSSESDSD